MDKRNLDLAASAQLDRILGFFARADAKASVVLAVDTGMLAFAAAKVPPLNSLNWWEAAVACLTLLLIGVSVWYLYRGAFPSLKGGERSLVYFREIAKRTEAKFIEDFKNQSEADHEKDLLGQVWRNSEILKEKFDCLKKAFILLALAIPPWMICLVVFTLKMTAIKTVSPN
jgi:hypothetical protein